jgi:hypothetical protein
VRERDCRAVSPVWVSLIRHCAGYSTANSFPGLAARPDF